MEIINTICQLVVIVCILITLPFSIVWFLYSLITIKDKKKPIKLFGISVMCIIVFSLIGTFVSFDSEKLLDNNNATTKVAESQTNEIITNENTSEEITTKEKEEKTTLSKEEKKQEYIKKCKEYNYKDVLRNPSDYIGNKIKVTVQISSIHEEGILNPTKYYFGYSEGEYGWFEDLYGIYDKRSSEKPKLLEGDIIIVYGEIIEPQDTTSLILQSTEVFCIDMKYVELLVQ